MSSPKGIGGSVREGTRIVLKEITATLHNSPPIQPPRRKSGNDSPANPKAAEHEVKVRFAREFADVASATITAAENHQHRLGSTTPESLSSASSFRSLSSVLSSAKSSSGICADSTPDTPDDQADTSYVNSNIPGVEDLIFGCADIHLGSDSQDLSQDQTFASAIDDVSFHASDCSVDENLDEDADDPAPHVIGTNPWRLHHETTASPSLSFGETRVPDLPADPLPVEDTQSPSVAAQSQTLPWLEEQSPRLQEDPASSEEPGDVVASQPGTCGVESNAAAENTPTSDDRVTVTINSTLPDDLIPDVNSESFNEQGTVECYRNAETSLSPEKPASPPTQISVVPSVPPLVQHAEDPSVPDISGSSVPPPLTDTDNGGAADGIVDDVAAEPAARVTSPVSLSASDDADKESLVLPQTHVNSPIIEAGRNVIIEKPDLLRLDNRVVTDNGAVGAQLLNRSGIIAPEPSEEEEEVQVEGLAWSDAEIRDTEIRDTAVSIEAPSLLPGEHVAAHDETTVVLEEQCCDSLSETVIVDSAVATKDADEKKKGSSFEELNRTLTLQEIEDINLTPDEEHYEEFKPQRQSTTLSSLISEQPDFEKLRFTAEQVTNELLDPSSEPAEEIEQFVSATSEIFQDPSSFDFLLARSNSWHTSINRLRTESLYIKFDPLVSNVSMLPQGNAPPINDEQNGKNESPPPNVDTPKRNPAIAAIDRLLFYSPSGGAVQKLEETQEKIEQPTEEPKPDTPLIADVDMSKELEIVRTSVLQLEDELGKQKKEHAAELERQKAAYQEKINKVQTQMAQEVKTKTQMSVVVEEYEKSISRLLTERERDRTNFEQEKAKLQEELQAANHHLTNTEAAFNDVHQKYERLKGVVSVYKNNEAVLKESIQENVDTIKTLETRYDQLKEHAMGQLEKANLQLDGIRKQHDAETVKLHAMIRKAELKSNSLAELVEQKSKENRELAKILDEVIARVGHGNAE